MFGTTIPRHPKRLPEDTGGLTVIIPAHYESYIPVLLAVWLLAWGAMETVLICSLVDRLRGTSTHPTLSLPILTVLLASFTGAGLFMAWRLLWVSRGREILELTSERLRLHREPGGHTENYSRSGIHNLHIGSYSTAPIYPSWGRRFLGKEEAFIGFEYEGKSCEIARGILRHDAEYVLDLLRSA